MGVMVCSLLEKDRMSEAEEMKQRLEQHGVVDGDVVWYGVTGCGVMMVKR